jgi:hypothetical protein
MMDWSRSQLEKTFSPIVHIAGSTIYDNEEQYPNAPFNSSFPNIDLTLDNFTICKLAHFAKLELPTYFTYGKETDTNDLHCRNALALIVVRFSPSDFIVLREVQFLKASSNIVVTLNVRPLFSIVAGITTSVGSPTSHVPVMYASVPFSWYLSPSIITVVCAVALILINKHNTINNSFFSFIASCFF